MKERITTLISALKMNVTSFSELIGVSKDTVRMYVDRGSKPKADFVEKVFRSIENLNPTWWLTGDGEVFLDKTNNKGGDSHSKAVLKFNSDNALLQFKLNQCEEALKEERGKNKKLEEKKEELEHKLELAREELLQTYRNSKN